MTMTKECRSHALAKSSLAFHPLLAFHKLDDATITWQPEVV